MKTIPHLCWCIMLLILSGTALFSQNTTLDMQEVSRFCYAPENPCSWNSPVIDYPYVFLPDKFGFQISQWDSTAGSFQRRGNFGLNGEAREMVKWQHYLLISIVFDQFTNIQSDYPSLYKIDISDPLNPVIVDSVTVGIGITTYGNLHIVDDVLVSYTEEDGFLTGMILINPVDLSEIETYPDYYHFDVILGDYIITRPMSAVAFNLFSVSSTGLVESGLINLPYVSGTFPLFIPINTSKVATQCGSSVILWQAVSPLEWIQQGSIIDAFQFAGNYYIDRLVLCKYVNNTFFFCIYDIQDLSQPALLNTCSFPQGLETDGGAYNILTYGSFLFCNTGVYSFVCLRLTSGNTIQFCSKTYEFNGFYNTGRKYGNYVLQPICFDGVACFDVSNPANPQYAFTLFEGNNSPLELNGHYMITYLYPLHSNASEYRIYDIANLPNPVLIASHPLGISNYFPFFNKNEAEVYYTIDNVALQIAKYQIVDNAPVQFLTYPLPAAMESAFFVNDVLYTLLDSPELNRHIYIFDGFLVNNPQPPQIISDLIPNFGWIYEAGNYLFVRTFDFDNNTTFYNRDTRFQVDYGFFGFAFRNYCCMGRENGISFYNTNGAPTGYVEEDYWLPEYSNSGYIASDDSYMYVFGRDNIAIYAYQLTDNDDNTMPIPEMEIAVYPNPIRTSATFELTRGESKLKPLSLISIYNLKGQKIKSLFSVSTNNNQISAKWDGTDYQGSLCSNGIYLIKVSFGDMHSITKKFTVLH